MQAAWLIHPLVLYAMLAVSLALCLLLFVTVKAEMRAMAVRERRRREALETEVDTARAEADALRAGMTALRTAVDEVRETSGALVAPAPPRSGLNLSVRAQVLRRYRLGEEPDAVAAALGIPRAEVDLLIKVNRILTDNLLSGRPS